MCLLRLRKDLQNAAAKACHAAAKPRNNLKKRCRAAGESEKGKWEKIPYFHKILRSQRFFGGKTDEMHGARPDRGRTFAAKSEIFKNLRANRRRRIFAPAGKRADCSEKRFGKMHKMHKTSGRNTNFFENLQ